MDRSKSWRNVLVEGIVIIASILLAFAIDAAWDRRNESVTRQELIEALTLDFETTGERLDGAIRNGDLVLNLGRELLLAVTRDEQLPVDSLRALMAGFFTAIRFEPALAAYEAAVGERGLASLRDRDFLNADSEFRRAHNFYRRHSVIGSELFYLGPTLEMRQDLGSLGVLLQGPADCSRDPAYNCPYPAAFDLSSREFLSYIARPRVYGALENIHNLQVNTVMSLREMREATNQVVAALRAME